MKIWTLEITNVNIEFWRTLVEMHTQECFFNLTCFHVRYYQRVLRAIALDQGWATLRVTRASIFSPLYQGARLLIHVHTPFTPSTNFLLLKK